MRRPLFLFLLVFALRADIPEVDQRGRTVRDQNTPRTFTTVTNAADWKAQSEAIRNQIQMSCGLYPSPDRTPLKARIFDRIERDGYSVEKVHFQPFPGLYVAGNLYRPLGKGNGPFPAVLNPHGHSESGRLTDTTNFSTVARCIQFARMGMVAFSYDMLGYNDSAQFSPRNADGSLVRPKDYDNHAALFRDPTNQLWGLSLMGVQLWNSIRAVDFLQSLPDVDPGKIGCTGESGGATQTILLAALDPWIQVFAPVAMVSHTMQGGCWCENAPGLRVDFSNLEIAAASAPRPQLLVGASGDWTKTTLEVEGPAVAGVYRLLGAEEKFRAVRFDYGHNYNRTSREAVYGWFAHWLQGRPEAEKIAELPYEKEPDAALRVFPDGKYPADALTEAQFTAAWIAARKEKVLALRPKDTNSMGQLMALMQNYWVDLLQLDPAVWKPGGVVSEWAIGRPGRGDRIEKQLTMLDPDHPPKFLVIFAHPDGKAAVGPGGARERLAGYLLAKGYAVLGLDLFQTGPGRDAAIARRSPFTNYFTTYNRTVLQQRAQDLITAFNYAKDVLHVKQVAMVADGEAGLWALLTAIQPDALVADANAFDAASDAAWLDPERFFPGVRTLGGPAAVAAAAAPRPLWVHHTGTAFDTTWIREAYGVTGHPERLKIQADLATDKEIAAWLDALASP
ncbi:MAG TPA: acetylxylan esterase [Candidatus Limnocylindria bacterium]|nr:acetylxylan esterase [Candidatus Limnocylindria bacterium]